MLNIWVPVYVAIPNMKLIRVYEVSVIKSIWRNIKSFPNMMI